MVEEAMRQSLLHQIKENIYSGGIAAVQESNEEFDIYVNCTWDQTYFIPKKVIIKLMINDGGQDEEVIASIDWKALDLVYEIIKPHYKTDKKILIHCAYGNNRSSFVVAYLLKRLENLSIEEGYKLCKDCGSEPQERFEIALKRYFGEY